MESINNSQQQQYDGKLLRLPAALLLHIRRYAPNGLHLFRQLSKEWEKATDSFSIKVINCSHSSSDISDISSRSSSSDFSSVQLFPFIQRKITAYQCFYESVQLNGFRLNDPISIRQLNTALSHPNCTLQILKLSNNNIPDCSFLRFLYTLKSLDLSQNTLIDISPVRGLTNLTDLNVSKNQINDISALGDLISLVHLDISKNQVINVQHLMKLMRLETLDISNNQFILNEVPLHYLKKLRTTQLTGNMTEVYEMKKLENKIKRFQHACELGHLEIIKYLLNSINPHKLNIFSKDAFDIETNNIKKKILAGFTAACDNGQFKTAQWLYDQNVNDLYDSLDTISALDPTIVKAIEKNDVPLIIWLSEHRMLENVNEYHIVRCCRKNHEMMVKILVEYNCNDKNNKLLDICKGFCRLCDKRFNGRPCNGVNNCFCNNRGNNFCTPIFYAIKHRNATLAQFLLDHGGQEDVTFPCATTYVNFLDMPLFYKPAELVTPMYVACSQNSIDLCQWLYDHGASEDVTKRTNNGLTPMFAACKSNHINIVEWLYNHGASKDVTTCSETNGGFTPMHCACKNANLEIAEWLFNHGASQDIHRADKKGCLPIHHATHLDTFKWLRAHGADISAVNKGGITPMYYACSFQNLEVAQWLFDHGASKDVKRACFGGKFPMLSACQKNNFNVVKWLCEHGAAEDIVRVNEKKVGRCVGFSPLTIAHLTYSLKQSSAKLIKWLIKVISEEDFLTAQNGVLQNLIDFPESDNKLRIVHGWYSLHTRSRKNIRKWMANFLGQSINYLWSNSSDEKKKKQVHAVLLIYESLCRGFCHPLKKEHKDFAQNILIPLKQLNLSDEINQLFEKDGSCFFDHLLHVQHTN
jgi:ankyrin repeat protein